MLQRDTPYTWGIVLADLLFPSAHYLISDSKYGNELTSLLLLHEKIVVYWGGGGGGGGTWKQWYVHEA